MNPGRHVHLAYPLDKMLHCVFGPQIDESHGFFGTEHCTSGGSPSYSGKQKQAALPPTIRQPLFGPHGFGEHSSPSGTGKIISIKKS